mgnify:CR=1 FL=1
MEYIRVIIADWMPVTVRGMTAYYFDEDGQAYYTIFINDKLSVEAQCAAYDHEIRHINNDDFHKMIPIEDLEAVRHESAG